MYLFKNIKQQYYLLSLRLEQDQDPNPGIMLIELIGGEIFIKSPFKTVIPDDLFEIQRSIPIICCFSGASILTRYEQGNQDELFSELEDDEFYKQYYITESGWQIESVVRKANIDRNLGILKEKGYFVIDFSIGLPIASLEHKEIHSDLVFNNLLYAINDGIVDSISSCELVNSSITLGDDQFEGQSLQMMASVINFLENGSGNFKILNENKNNLFYYKNTKRLFITGIAFIFSILLINFILLSQIQGKLNVIQGNGQINLEKQKDIEALRTKYNEYIKIISPQEMGIKNKYSFYADRLSILKPDGIWFNRLIIDPPPDKIDKNKQIQTQKKIVFLTGETLDPGLLNKYIIDIKKEDWAEDVSIKKYNKKFDNGAAEFSLILNLK